MAEKYRYSKDDKPELKKTISSFSDDTDLNKAKQIRRNDDVNLPSVGLYEIDMAFKYFLEEGIKPSVSEGDSTVPVPVMYASPERWSAAQKDGYLRDENGKLMTPLISFKKNSVSLNQNIAKLKVLTETETSRTFVRKYTQQNKYDAFSELVGQKPVPEYYMVDTPDYVNIDYDVIIWCDHVSQLNNLVEQIIYFQGGAFGERYKFEISGDTYNFDVTNNVGEDRIARSNFTLTSKAYLLPKNIGNAVNAKKAFGTSKVVWKVNVDK
jgi:hypothetical protein